jgi:hypothetical protein
METGSGLPGVTVLQKNTLVGSISDADGNFSVNVSNNDAILVFSYVGFTTVELAVGSQNQLKVILSEDATALSEIVVTGYGTQKKSQVTGAISRLSSKEISELPITNLAQALTGRATGVNCNSIGL